MRGGAAAVRPDRGGRLADVQAQAARVAYVIGTFAGHPAVMGSMNAFLKSRSRLHSPGQRLTCAFCDAEGAPDAPPKLLRRQGPASLLRDLERGPAARGEGRLR